MHCVAAHLSPFLAKHGRGMADICEQVGEAAHYAMAPVLQRNKVAASNPKHRERQLTAVVKYASCNVYNMSGNKKSRRSVKKE